MDAVPNRGTLSLKEMEPVMKITLYTIVLGLSLAFTVANICEMTIQDQSPAAFDYATTGFFFGLIGILFSSLGLVQFVKPR